jgi:predicted DsbA family dithiol-disulfide isomerase
VIGSDIGDRATLVEIASGLGLNAAKAEELLQDNVGIAEITVLKQWAANQGVQSIPTYFLNGQ